MLRRFPATHHHAKRQARGLGTCCSTINASQTDYSLNIPAFRYSVRVGGPEWSHGARARLGKGAQTAWAAGPDPRPRARKAEDCGSRCRTLPPPSPRRTDALRATASGHGDGCAPSPARSEQVALPLESHCVPSTMMGTARTESLATAGARGCYAPVPRTKPPRRRKSSGAARYCTVLSADGLTTG